MLALTPLHLLLQPGRWPVNTPLCHDGQTVVSWQHVMQRLTNRQAMYAAAAEVRWLIIQDHPLDFLIDLLALLAADKQAVIPPNNLPGTVDRLRAAWDACTPPHMVNAAENAPPPGGLFIDPNKPAIHLYTSGSTGEPKSVIKTLQHFETEIESLEAVWGTDMGDSAVVSTAPHQHFYGLLFRLLWPLTTGRVFDTTTCADPDTLTQRLWHFGRAVLVSSPAQLGRLPEWMEPTSLTPRLVRVFSSGGPLPAQSAHTLAQAWGRAPTEVFGSTETGGIAWREQGVDDSWTPFPGIGVSAAADGALLLQSPLVDGDAPYAMDDAVALLPDGRFRLLGRLDRVVKIEEKRVSLPDVEYRLRQHEWVADAAAVALPTERRQVLGVALVLSAAGRQQLELHGRAPTTRALRQHLASEFEAVALPRRWRFLERLPLDERGKLTPAVLRPLFALPSSA